MDPVKMVTYEMYERAIHDAIQGHRVVSECAANHFTREESYPAEHVEQLHRRLTMNEAAIRDMYHRIYRKPREGTIAASVTSHWQACGFVAYAFDLHPNRVAEIVADRRMSRSPRQPPERSS